MDLRRDNCKLASFPVVTTVCLTPRDWLWLARAALSIRRLAIRNFLGPQQF